MLAAARERLKFCANVQKVTRGRKPDPCVEIVLNGPPAFAHPDSDDWPERRNIEWAEQSVEHVRKRAGRGSVVANWALHQDESSAHVHVLLVVADEQGHAGWNRVRHRFGVTGRERGRNLMSAMQTAYALEVGLPRGEKRKAGRPAKKYDSRPKDRALAEDARVIELERHRRIAEGERDRAVEALRVAQERHRRRLERERAASVAVSAADGSSLDPPDRPDRSGPDRGGGARRSEPYEPAASGGGGRNPDRGSGGSWRR